jgi:SAM-dependent methyltransferase
MSFEVTANAYYRFMGRYSEPLADQFLELLDLRDGQRVLDVGCGPGALTQRLVECLGADAVTAVDPSESFVAAVRSRIPSIDVHRAAAEDMPFGDGHFDCAAAQLVVHFMKDPVAGITEMARVTSTGGVVAACVWDYAGRTGPLTAFWRAVRALDPGAPDESRLAGAREGHLVQLFQRAGLGQIDATRLTVRVPPASTNGGSR